MYDKIRFIVYRTKGKDEFSYLSNLVDNPTRIIDEATGEIGGLSGSKRNLRVREYTWGLSIEGSLCKWLHDGSNLYDMSFDDAGHAISQISNELQTNLLDASVTRLEFGANIVLNNTVSQYFQILGDMPNRQRDPLSHTSLYYRRRTKKDTESFVFYDKLAEARKHDLPVPDELSGANVMRIELRYDRYLNRQFKQPVYGKTLLEYSFYQELKNRLIESYSSIAKIEKVNIDDMSTIQKPKDATNLFFALQFAKNADGQQSIEDYLQMLSDNGVFKRRADKTRVRKQIYAVLQMAAITSGDPLRIELDNAFERLKSAD